MSTDSSPEAEEEPAVTEVAEPEDSPTEAVRRSRSPTEAAEPEDSPMEAAEPDDSPTEAAEPEGSPTEEARPSVPTAACTGVLDSEPVSVTDSEDDADSAGCAASPVVSSAPDDFVCSSLFIQRPRRFSRMRIDTSMGVPLNPKVSRRRRMMNRR